MKDEEHKTHSRCVLLTTPEKRKWIHAELNICLFRIFHHDKFFVFHFVVNEQFYEQTFQNLASLGASRLLNPPSFPSSIYWHSQKIKIMLLILSSHFACGLCLREQGSPEFSQSLNRGESLEFFQVPEPIWRRQKSDSSHRAIGIFPSPKV